MIRKVAAFVIDYRSPAEAIELTLQLARSQRLDFELTIFHVDNGNSESGTLTSEQAFAGVRLLRNDRNQGYAGGVLGALKQIPTQEFDAYWILNSDLEVEPDTLKKLVQVLNRNPRVAAVGPRVMKGRSEKVWGARGVVSPVFGVTAMTDWTENKPLPKWSYITGSSLLVRRVAFEEAGGMPDRYRLYFEETELCVQLQKKGWDLWVEPTARAYHAVQSLKGDVPARHYAFYFTRNSLYFWKRNFGIPWFVQLPRTTYTVLRHLVLPLRRADSVGVALDRMKFVAMGFIDGFEFLFRQHTYFEKRHFDV